ncbi:MAG: Fpg/Nei family DNA glycosylase [Acidobacteria bacterium]|nr:Fpg/Nei family DNA glycosylase [Acidobacteriota bacterium]
MPEGNEIHRWAERHGAAFVGKPVRVDGPQGRFVDGDVLDGRRLLRVMAVGKHLGYDFGRDRILHVHLGLQGDFTEGSGALPPVKGALRLRMWSAARVKLPAVPGESKRHAWYSSDDGTGHLRPEEIAWVELRGPMDCSVWTNAQWEMLLERLGPDPLCAPRDGGDGPEKAMERIAKSKKPIGLLLMEQDVMAGVGNIYRAELLFRARQSPFTPGREVEAAVVKKMWKEAGPLMRAGMVDRRIVTTLAKHRERKAGKVQVGDEHYVYRRNGKECRVCGGVVMKQEGFGGRNLFWCPECQAG